MSGKDAGHDFRPAQSGLLPPYSTWLHASFPGTPFPESLPPFRLRRAERRGQIPPIPSKGLLERTADHVLQFLIRTGTQHVLHVFKNTPPGVPVPDGEAIVKRIQVMDAVIKDVDIQRFQEDLKFFNLLPLRSLGEFPAC